MPRTVQAEIITPDAVLYSGEVTSIVVTAPDGEVGVLPMHAPLIAELGEGILRFTREDDDIVETFTVKGGYLQIAEDKAIVLTNYAERTGTEKE